ncbi:MAG: hypothetical protein R6V35_00480 [Candidatus Nanohaloarchaea archaeon]
MKDQNVLEEDWDYLIVLDACRYDIFEEVYEDYFKGNLEKRKSVASSTPEWASKVFTGEHDITYFSSNPFINDVGLPLNEIEWGSSCGYEWNATEHISNIIDVWHEGWDDELGTVTPEKMNEVVRDHMDEVEESDRTIIHYMQPHAPYITKGRGRKVEQIRKSFKEAKEEGLDEESGVLGAVGDKIKPKFESVVEDSTLAMKLGMLLELNPSSLFSVGRDGTRETLMEYYEDNLRLALEEARELSKELDGEVVITADHGEAFGEQGVWEHHIETHIPALVEVPWLIVEDTVE